MLVAYIICAGIWLAILFWWVIPVIRKRMFYEIYMACGLGIYFSLIVLGDMLWKSGNILPLRYVGYISFIPGAIFVVFAFISLKHRGKPTSGWEPTTKLVEAGIFRIVRHPLYLGSAFFTVGMILVIQSVPSTLLGCIAIFCFWMASKGEDKFNVQKFGDAYREYMERIPLWNFLAGLYRLRRW
jgi:protein-S-isoprenylcysteine O-methyltransferase Ste14